MQKSNHFSSSSHPQPTPNQPIAGGSHLRDHADTNFSHTETASTSAPTGDPPHLQSPSAEDSNKSNTHAQAPPISDTNTRDDQRAASEDASNAKNSNISEDGDDAHHRDGDASEQESMNGDKVQLNHMRVVKSYI